MATVRVKKPDDAVPDDSEVVIGLSKLLLGPASVVVIGEASEDVTPVLRDGV